MWAILPARVRYDREIPPNAKLLFAEIAAKTNDTGECFCSNDWFTKRLGFTDDTVRNLLKALEGAGYIHLDTDNHRAVQKRIIRVENLAFAFLDPEDDGSPRKISGAQPPKNFEGDPRKNSGDKINIYINNKPPSWMPADVLAEIAALCGENGALAKAWMDFAEMRHRKHTPIATVCTVQRTASTLRKLSKGDPLRMIAILDQSTDNGWTGVFAIKEETGKRPERWGGTAGGWADDPEVLG